MKKLLSSLILSGSLLASAGASADDIGGGLALVGAGTMSGITGAMITMDTTHSYYISSSTTQFETDCYHFPLGNALLIDTATTSGQDMLELSQQALADGQDILVSYTVEPVTTDCLVDSVIVAPAGTL